MDYSKKPDKGNPRNGANLISQLLFLWIIPLLRKGKNGLNTDDLSQHLNKDSSADLGDSLEREWNRQIEKSSKTNRKEILRYTLFNTFFPMVIIDGLFQAIALAARSVVPFVLAQILKQFQNSYNSVLYNTIEKSNFTFPLNTTENEFIILNSEYSSIEIDKENNFYNLNNSTTLNANDFIKNQHLVQLKLKIESNETLEQFFIYIWNDVYCLSFLIIVLLLMASLSGLHADFRQRMVGARMRIACSSLIYRKTLRLSKKSTSQISTGHLINLLSNDVSRFDTGFIYIHYLWILPLQSFLTCYLIWREVNIAAIIGVVILILQTIPLQTALSRLSSVLRTKVAIRTDLRVGIMNEIIQGIQVIKMYAWEKPFHAVVAAVRSREVKQVCFASYVGGIYLSARIYTARTTLFITMLTMFLLGQDIKIDIVFAMAQFFTVLQLTTATFYPLAIACGAEAIAAIKRIEEYLLLDENNKNHNINTYKKLNGELTQMELNMKIMNSTIENSIEIMNVKAAWANDCDRLTLDDIILNVKAGQLLAIIGPVGAGKSSLLHLLLKELPIYSGKVFINGDTSYAAQEPWLFSSTVRNNILFGELYDKKKYNEIIKCCALATDFKQLPYGDKSIVGEKGVILSGGQRARISLARAIYKQAKIYLLDDPLSAVDAHVGKYLFEQVIGPNGRLAAENSTRILITHQVHFLKTADVIVIIENGRIIRTGTYEELSNSNLDFAQLLKKSDNNENEQCTDDVNDDVRKYANNNDIGISTITRKLRNSLFGSKRSRNISVSSDDLIKNANEEQETVEKQTAGTVSFSVWKTYFKSSGSIYKIMTLIIVLIVSQIIISGLDYFVKYLTQQEEYRLNGIPTTFSIKECFYIFGSITIGVILICYVRCYLFLNMCMNSSNKLHNQMFECLLNAPMRFFDTNPSGRILNRFSKDMGSVDELLPKTMLESLQILLIMVGILVTIVIENSLMILPLFVGIIFYILILRLYLRPSQDLKRIEGATKSPVFSHLSYTLSGISTIRSRNLQKHLINEFDNLQNVHSAVWQLVISSSTALGLWLDCVSICFVGCVTFSFMAAGNLTFSGSIGLAISQALLLTGMVPYGLKQTTEAIQQMTSAERILQYGDIEQERCPKKEAEKNWPQNGTIKFNNMSLRYDPNEGPILKNLCINIESNWKVGIIGRTGAGKSSIINAIFRLSSIEGEILIDGIDTSTISLESLRSKISIIPQDPVLFSATIRYNLDPFNLFTDEVLWKALEDVELKQSVISLDYMVNEGGSNFSVGQRQLICLARAILRNNKILILDEATANCDPQTDILIQNTIRNKFKLCTVLTVAHRLHTVMDSDRILVMDDGYAKEFDIPHLLLEKDNSILKNLVEVTGPQESESLKRTAFLKYKELIQ